MFSTLDWIIVGLYCVGIICLATYVSRKEDGVERNAEDYFLAGRSLPWWAIGASLIAANISAEQIIGMSGQGFVVGMAIACMGANSCNCFNSDGKIFFTFISRKKNIYDASVLRAKVR
jgi:SSS family solute:Na+ symporter